MRKICLALFLAALSFYGELSYAGGDIVIPSPKNMRVVEKNINISNYKILNQCNDKMVVHAIEEINKTIEKSGGKALSVESGKSGSGQGLIIVSANENGSGNLDKSSDQGYFIKFKGGNFYLTGNDVQGAAYACITFSHLVKVVDNKVYADNIEISDWPDYKFRNARIIICSDIADDAGLKEAFSYIDWCFRYKFNFIYFNYAPSMTETEKTAAAAKKQNPFMLLNEYARERGITMTTCLDTSVGSSADKGKAEFEGTTEWHGRYYTWGNDSLINKKSEQIAAQIKRQKWGCIMFHPIDVPSEKWEQRDAASREKFGDDRAKATAYLAGKYTDALRRAVEHEVKIVWVVQPYNINLNLKGNEEYKSMIRKISKTMPEDILFLPTIISKDAMDSWLELNRSFFLWKNDPYATELGIYYSSIIPFIAKSSYRTGRHDVFAPLSFPLSGEDTGRYRFNWYPAEATVLAISEYSWNAGALGDEFVINEKQIDPSMEEQPDTYGVFRRDFILKGEDGNFTEWVWNKSYKEPASVAGDFLKKSCIEAYGEEGGKIMAEIFNMGICPFVICEMQPKYYKKLQPRLFAGWNTAESLRAQTEKLNSAINMLENFKKTGGTLKKNTACGKDFCQPLIDQFKLIRYVAEARLLAGDVRKSPDNADAVLERLDGIIKELSNIKTDYSNWQIKEKLDQEKNTIMKLKLKKRK